MADVSHAAVITAFQTRYDYQSARNVLAAALKDSGLGEKDKYDAGDLTKIGEALSALGERGTEGVLEAASGGAAAAEAAPEKAEKAAKAPKKATKKATKKK